MTDPQEERRVQLIEIELSLDGLIILWIVCKNHNFIPDFQNLVKENF